MTKPTHKLFFLALFCVILLGMIPNAKGQQKLIYYWHFNNLNTGLTKAVSPASIPTIHANWGSLDSTKALISYVPATTVSSKYTTYWDAVAGDASDTFNVISGVKGVAAGNNALRVRNPCDSMQVVFSLPTTNYKNITLKFSTERSSTTSGPGKQSFDYSTNGGSTWKTSGLSVTSDSFANAVWNFQTVSLSADATVGNNSGFMFRIKLGIPNTGTSGNARFDNITLEGDSILPAISLPGINTVYKQDFDSLANSGTSSVMPYGWYIYESGTNANNTYGTDSGASTSGNTYSYGHKNSTNRSLGSLASGSLLPNYGVAVRNNTGSTLNNLTVAYTEQQWRLGSNTRGFPDSMHAFISYDASGLSNGKWTSITGLDMTSPVTSGTVGPLDGNSSANQARIKYTIKGLSVKPGALFWLKWADPNVLSSDDGLAMDDFTISTELSPLYKIGTVRTQNANGVADSLNKAKGYLKGVVTTPTYSSTYLQFSLVDNTGAITIYAPSVKNYTATVGDSVEVRGYVTQYNGLTEYTTDSVIVLKSGTWMETPAVLTVLDEAHESHLITLKNVHILTPSQWTGTGSGFNVDISDGKDTFSMRITNSIDLYSKAAITGNFDVTGNETQFKSSSPYIGGYQIEPRGVSDIKLIPAKVLQPLYKIGIVRTQNTNGVADSLNKAKGYLKGVVTTPTYSATYLQFSLVDNTGAITIYAPSVKNYTAVVGDSVEVRGYVTQYNGLTEYTTDSIIVLKSGSWMETPSVLTILDESHESHLITIKNVHILTPSQWTGTGSGFNVDISDGKDTFSMRITNSIDLYSKAAITGNFNVTGNETQFKSSSPYIGGYQIEPRGVSDINLILAKNLQPLYKIGDVRTQNSNGVADSLNKAKGFLKGVVTTPTYSATYLQFSLVDNTGAITIYAPLVKNYTAKVGDSVEVRGYVTQYNGLTEYTTDSIIPLNSGSWMETPAVLTALDETHESHLITLKNVHILTPSQWTGTGTGFNVDISNGKDTFSMRITNAIDLYSKVAITGNFNVTGNETQFKSSSPYIGGYQIEPRGVSDIELLGMPKPQTPLYKIRQVRGQNAITGVADSAGSKYKFFLKGIVQSPTFSLTADNFSIKDSTGSIIIYGASKLNGYTPKIGDSVQVRGLLTQFNGLTEVSLDSISNLAGSNPVLSPKTITKMDESTESWLVKFNNSHLINPLQWTGTGSGFNVDITNGKDTIQMRVTNAVDLYSKPAPKGKFNVTGIVGQYISSSPYIGGYQLQPRGMVDIQPIPLKLYTISQVKGYNATTGVADSITVACLLHGVVHSGNLIKGPAQFFTLKDNTGAITIVAPAMVNSYMPAEGDSILVRGMVSQTNGLNVFVIDSVSKKMAGTVKSPVAVSKIDESTESDLISLSGYKLVNLAQWDTTGAKGRMFVKAWKASADTITLAVLGGTNLYLNSAKPGSYFDVVGIGSQYDLTAPYLQNYVIIPRSTADITHSTGIESTIADDAINVYPNPTAGRIQIIGRTDLTHLEITDLSGKIIVSQIIMNDHATIDLANIKAGVYFLNLYTTKGKVVKMIVKN